MTILCAFCSYSPPFRSTPAVFIIDGQAVCRAHVDDADGPFGPSLAELNRRNDDL